MWLDVCKNKYLRNRSLKYYSIKGSESNCFKGTLRAIEALQNRIGSRIGSSKTVSLFFDRWLGVDTLAYLMNNNIEGSELAMNERDSRPHQAVPMHEIEGHADRVIFLGSKNGAFTVKNAYHCQQEDGDSNANWNWIWCLKCQPKVHFFIWLCLQGG